MATYKVPQDVEADDKLIGPFSFRQFIYLIVVAICAGLAWGLYTVFPGLVIIPIPVALFFLVLALPLKKDQPFEVYLAAMVQFALKPKMRMWEPEGMVNLVEINSDKPPDVIQLKEFSGSEASKRLGYLADVVDTGGWASRGVTAPVGASTSPLNDVVQAESDATDDVMDDDGHIGQSFGTLLDNVSRERRANMESIMRQSASATDDQTSTTQPTVIPTDDAASLSDLRLDTPKRTFDIGLPTPVLPRNVQPITSHTVEVDAAHQQYLTRVAEETFMARQQEMRADIIRLANNDDLSVSAISREANRIKGLEQGEVSVDLR